DSNPWMNVPRTSPIPKIFHSLEADGPFQKCLQCGCNLFDGRLYMIERVFRDTEPIIEYALCQSCVQQLSEELSTDSRQAITTYFQEHINLAERAERIRHAFASGEVEPWLEECIVTGNSWSNCRERQICAWCEGDQVRLDMPPLMISGPAVEAMSEHLSEQTRGWMSDFVGDNFGMPSEFIDAPDLAPIFL
ncbi:MAG: hypothetical protein O3A00_03965, partial [Planctomycetota bacterium]|nr:hypothetical protein [Planctomycetota bacterium]